MRAATWARVEQVVGWLRARDLRVVLELAVVAGLAWMFIELADVVAEGETRAIDVAILQALRTDAGDPVGPGWLERALVDLSALGSGAVAATVVIVTIGFLLLARRGHMAALVAVTSLGTFAVMTALKSLIGRERPSEVAAVYSETGLSFPSGHAMIGAALYLTLGVLLARSLEVRRLQLYVIGAAASIAVVVGLTRVYLGVHYPSDVLGGWTIGLAWALLCGVVARRLQRGGVVEPPGEHAVIG